MSPYWAQDPDEVARALGSSTTGLSSTEAARRLAEFGPNEIRARGAASRLRIAWRQIRSPLVLLLVFAAMASLFTSEWIDAALVGVILLASVGIGYGREFRAEATIAALLDRIQMTGRPAERSSIRPPRFRFSFRNHRPDPPTLTRACCRPALHPPSRRRFPTAGHRT